MYMYIFQVRSMYMYMYMYIYIYIYLQKKHLGELGERRTPFWVDSIFHEQIIQYDGRGKALTCT